MLLGSINLAPHSGAHSGADLCDKFLSFFLHSHTEIFRNSYDIILRKIFYVMNK